VTTNDSWRRYLEAGAAVGQVTLARAEGIARGLFAPDDEERETAWRDLDELTRFGRLMGDQLIDMARAEMSRQLETLGAGSLEHFLDRIADLVRSQPVDAPSRSAEPVTECEHLEPVPEAGPSGSRRAGTAREETEPTHHKGRDSKAAKRSKAKRDKTKRAKSGTEGAKSERTGDKKHKKNEKKHKKEKGPGSLQGVSGPNRLLTLAPPPDSAGHI
jgi:hypothetical protein